MLTSSQRLALLFEVVFERLLFFSLALLNLSTSAHCVTSGGFWYENSCKLLCVLMLDLRHAFCLKTVSRGPGYRYFGGILTTLAAAVLNGRCTDLNRESV
jgi:hypothetical protein